MKRMVLLLAFGLIGPALLSCSDGDLVPGGSGLVEATEVTVSAETSGRLEYMYADEGDRIGQGEVVVLIDTTSTALLLKQARARRQAATAQVESARLRLEQARLDDSLAQKEYDRLARLVAAGSANQQQYDRAENAAGQTRLANKAAAAAVRVATADLAAIEANIALLEKQWADCRPMSPVTGTVITTFVETGELITAGRPILKIARLDTVWVKIYFPPADLTRIKLGDRAEVDPEDGRSQPLAGTVSWISAEAEFTPKNVQTRQARADLVYAVKISIPNPDQVLKIGMPVSVRIP